MSKHVLIHLIFEFSYLIHLQVDNVRNVLESGLVNFFVRRSGVFCRRRVSFWTLAGCLVELLSPQFGLTAALES